MWVRIFLSNGSIVILNAVFPHKRNYSAIPHGLTAVYSRLRKLLMLKILKTVMPVEISVEYVPCVKKTLKLILLDNFPVYQ